MDPKSFTSVFDAVSAEVGDRILDQLELIGKLVACMITVCANKHAVSARDLLVWFEENLEEEVACLDKD